LDEKQTKLQNSALKMKSKFHKRDKIAPMIAQKFANCNLAGLM